MGGYKRQKKKSNRGIGQGLTRKNARKIATGFRDNFGNVIQADELIFPIVYHNEKLNVFHAIGTGFFVHPNGGFITAKHVLFNNDKRIEPCYAIQTLSGGKRIMRKIIAFFPHETADIGMGMLGGKLVKGNQIHLVASFAISLSPPNIKDNIRTYAFPKSEVKIENNIQVGIFKGSWSGGTITSHIEAGQHHLLKSDAFETNMLIASRASGGPVLRGTSVIGVNSTGWEFEPGREPVSYITSILNVLDIVVRDSDGATTSVKELMEGGHMPFTA